MERTDKTGIYKHTICVTILTHEEDISDWDVAEIGREMSIGDFMGTHELMDVSPELTLEELEVQACGMGGEPTFFGEELDAEYIA